MDALKRMIAALPEAKPTQRRILEPGCGSGIISEFLARYGRVTGIDQSPVGVQAARTRGLGRFVIGTLPDIPVAEDGFDLCVLSQVLEHLADNDQAVLLTRLREKVRPGGHLILTVPNRPVSSRMRFAAGELQPIENWQDTADVHRLLRETGWQVLKTRFAFNFFPVAASRYLLVRAARYVLYDILGLRGILEHLLESPSRGDCIVVLATRAASTPAA
ncbi:MAG: methyltransferase domain-containing protein [Deltaproteobacteria bacterium]|nr:methyltransferase domain-containing protein [Deltaproteobacteria bacterium]